MSRKKYSILYAINTTQNSGLRFDFKGILPSKEDLNGIHLELNQESGESNGLLKHRLFVFRANGS